MIIVRMFGGLGNQMFQYAFGFSIAKSNAETLFLDIREFDESYCKNTKRIFELDKLHIHSSIISDEIKSQFQLTNYSTPFKIFRKIQKKLPLGSFGYFKELNYTFDCKLTSEIKMGYFDGYWQSPRYFSKYREEILKIFSPKTINEKNKLVAKKILNSNSVSLHVRRGDYVSDKNINSTHGECSLEYYYRAIKLLEEERSDLTFFLFSDDPIWVRQNLHINHPVEIIDFNGSENAHLDMYLMSLCQNHIIANSSFSWWGAWLSDYVGKIVIAPERWFQEDIDTSDLIPEEWIRL